MPAIQSLWNTEVTVDEWGAGGYGFSIEGQTDGAICHMLVTVLNRAWLRKVTPDREMLHAVSRPQKMQAVLEWLTRLSVPTPEAAYITFTAALPREKELAKGNVVAGFQIPGTEKWVWHAVELYTTCRALGGEVQVNIAYAVPPQISWELGKQDDLQFLLAACRHVMGVVWKERDKWMRSEHGALGGA